MEQQLCQAQAPVEEVVAAMKPLLQQGVKLVIVSGTTYDKDCKGKTS